MFVKQKNPQKGTGMASNTRTYGIRLYNGKLYFSEAVIDIAGSGVKVVGINDVSAKKVYLLAVPMHVLEDFPTLKSLAPMMTENTVPRRGYKIDTISSPLKNYYPTSNNFNPVEITEYRMITGLTKELFDRSKLYDLVPGQNVAVRSIKRKKKNAPVADKGTELNAETSVGTVQS